MIFGIEIFCFKKALFLIHAVSVRFGSADPAPFPVPSTSHLPVFSDNVLPSLLIHLGVIDISGSPNLSTLFPHAGAPEQLATLLATATVGTGDAKTLPKDGPVLSTNQAYILRAAAVDACELITEIAHKLDEPSLDWLREIQLPSLDMWIWAVAKDRCSRLSQISGLLLIDLQRTIGSLKGLFCERLHFSELRGWRGGN